MMSNTHDYREDLYNHHKAQITDIPDDSEDTLGEGCECWIQMPVALDPPIAQEYDRVTRPQHYVNQVPGVECWDVLKHFPYLRGTSIKYLWRAGDKDDIIQDLRKAIAYIQKEIELIEESRNAQN